MLQIKHQEHPQTSQGHRLKLLNIGCGSNIHSAWINLDLAPASPEVQRYDARRGLPFAENSVDACYSSHVLEHLKPSEAVDFLQQQFRVLKPGGTIRVVVPDLEGIVRRYLHELEQADLGNSQAQDNYDWMLLELLDQVVRDKSAGYMGQYLQNLQSNKNQGFIISRIGSEIRTYQNNSNTTIFQKFAQMTWSDWVQKIRYVTAGSAVAIIAGRGTQKSFNEGVFRNSGEIHRWMYDRFSLKRLLQKSGFQNVKTCRADESLIPNFNKYSLDILDGKIKKPDSLFVEGIKP
jgi:predicted SAM-dependent methyltransferase